jgi:hypothetical protein
MSLAFRHAIWSAPILAAATVADNRPSDPTSIQVRRIAPWISTIRIA